MSGASSFWDAIPAFHAKRGNLRLPPREDDEMKTDDASTEQKLREALAVYADARNWGIMRDEFKHPSAVWIGPGATATPVPDAPKVAREALA